MGPSEARPTRPNYAWGGVEPNLFGTDEFMAFCRAVGCEPMICVNAGDGTPEEAARWVQYCNGPADSPMGQRRAAAGHREAVPRAALGDRQRALGPLAMPLDDPRRLPGSLPAVPPGDAGRRPDDPSLCLRRPRAGRSAMEPRADPRGGLVAGGDHRSSADRRRRADGHRPAGRVSRLHGSCPTCWPASGASCSRRWPRPAWASRGWR